MKFSENLKIENHVYIPFIWRKYTWNPLYHLQIYFLAVNRLNWTFWTVLSRATRTRTLTYVPFWARTSLLFRSRSFWFCRFAFFRDDIFGTGNWEICSRGQIHSFRGWFSTLFLIGRIFRPIRVACWLFENQPLFLIQVIYQIRIDAKN